DRYRLPPPPEQRVSFFAELLPYLGKAGLKTQIQDRKFPWFAKENLNAAEAWVPELLVPYYPQESWRAGPPPPAGRGRWGGEAGGGELGGVVRPRLRFGGLRPVRPGDGEAGRHGRVRVGLAARGREGRAGEHDLPDPVAAGHGPAVDRWRRGDRHRRGRPVRR